MGSDETTIYSRVLEENATWPGWLNGFRGVVIYGDDLVNCTFDEDRGGYIVGYQGYQNNMAHLYMDTHKGYPIIEIDEYAFIESALNSVTVGQYSTHQINIKSNAFYQSIIPNIELNNNVTFDDRYEISLYEGKSNSVFYGSKVEQIILPSTLDYVLPMMFQDCKEMESISFINAPTQINNLPLHITAIDDLAFSGCELASLFVPSSVEKMGVAVFNEWSAEKGQEIYIDITEDDKEALIELWEETEGQEGWHEFWGSGCTRSIIEFWSTPGLAYTLLPNDTYSVSVGTATAESNIIFTSYRQGKQVYEIGAYGFYNCPNILGISLPRELKIIGDYAIANCTGLTTLKIHGSVVNLGFGMLSDCNNLTSLTIPYVGNTFEGTSNTNFGYIFGTTDINSQQYYVPSSLTTVNITAAKSIARSAFWNCYYLKNITVSDSVEVINISAFGECNSLTSITLPFVGARADGTTFTYFGYIFGASYYIPASLKTVTITGGNRIPPQAFYNGCENIETIIIPDSIKTIGYGAFGYCYSLRDFIIPEGVEYIDNGAFVNCISLTSITIPQSVTGMHDEVFWGCNNLETVILKRPASMGITDIGWSSFGVPYSCNKLTLIAVPDSASETAYKNACLAGWYAELAALIKYIPGYIT